jgi:flavin reductase (DIM6/NTAB) family NADH-FMN oxidoreductase RutF
MSDQPPTDVRSDALRLISNGVFVLTACLDETIQAATVTWVSQVSIEPPLVLVALRRNSLLAHAVRKARRFALNILGPNHDAIAQTFFEHLTAAQEIEHLGGYEFRLSPARCPLLMDGLAWLECRLAAEAESPGDHSLILGEVTGSGVRFEGKPLVLGETPWSYGHVAEA